jgi:hypothetical protein
MSSSSSVAGCSTGNELGMLEGSACRSFLATTAVAEMLAGHLLLCAPQPEDLLEILASVPVNLLLLLPLLLLLCEAEARVCLEYANTTNSDNRTISLGEVSPSPELSHNCQYYPRQSGARCTLVRACSMKMSEKC